MNFEYQRKYLKYKQKYFSLKNQVAGNENFEIGDIIFYQHLYYQVIQKDPSHISIKQFPKDKNNTKTTIITFSLKNDQEKIKNFKKKKFENN